MKAFELARFILPFAALMQAQQPPIRVSVNLVQVDAVVTGPGGKYVSGLTAKDFQILEDGKPQPITAFSDFGPCEANAPASKDIASHPKRIVAVLVDDLGLSWEGVALARDALRKFIRQDSNPADLIGVLRTGGGSGASQSLTSDRQALLAAVEQIRWNPLGTHWISSLGPREMVWSDSAARQRTAFLGLLWGLESVLKQLSPISGRKSVVLLSEGARMFDRRTAGSALAAQLERVAAQAHQAGVVLYAIDPRGAVPSALTASERVGSRSPMRVNRDLEKRVEEYHGSQSPLIDLARETGGFFFGGQNDIENGLAAVVTEQQCYYLIGYTPGVETIRKKRLAIQVKVKRAGLHVRSRSTMPGPSSSSSALSTAEPPQQRLLSAAPASAIELTLTSVFRVEESAGPTVTSWLHFDGGKLKFDTEPGGWKKAVVEAILVSEGPDGGGLGKVDKTFTLRLRDDAYRRALNQGLVLTVQQPAAQPGPFKVWAAVRDTLGPGAGSASQLLIVPDWRSGALALSGLVLGTENIAEDSDSLASPVVRRFRPGQRVEYACQVLNPTFDRSTGRPRLSGRLRIFDGRRPIYESPPISIEAEPAAASMGIMVRSNLRLGQAMKPGEYWMQFEVTDQLTPAPSATVSQWSDFHVLP